MKILTFFLNGVKYGLSIEYITSIEKNDRDITDMPGSNPNILGVVNVRGEIMPVIDVKRILGKSSGEKIDDQKLILFTYEGDKGALLVDDTDNILDVLEEEIEVMSMEKGDVKVANLDDGIFVLLDLKKIKHEIK